MDKSKAVLVVDDMSSLRKIVIRSLKTEFDIFIEAGDGNEAFELLKTANPPVGLIISDWNMPNCTGLDLLKLVRGNPEYARLPFVMVTSEAEKDQIMDAIKFGATGYVIKPFTADSLCVRIRAALEKAKQ